MKAKIVLATLLVLLVSCKSSMVSSDIKEDYRDDFRAMDEINKETFLQKLNATASSKSVLLFTQGFKGEKIVAKQLDKTIYSIYPITNKNTLMATQFGFNNQNDLLLFDNFSKKEIKIPSEKAIKHKFIYLKKENKGTETTYLITYSNTLRPF